MTNFSEARELLKSNFWGLVKILLLTFCFSFIGNLLSTVGGIFGSIVSIILSAFILIMQIIMINRFIINQDNLTIGELFEECIANFKENGVKTILSLLLFAFTIFLIALVGLVPFLGSTLLSLSSIDSGYTNIVPILFNNLLFLVIYLSVVIFFVSYLSSRLRYKIASRVFNVDAKNLISANNKDMLIMSSIITLLFLAIIILSIIPTLGILLSVVLSLYIVYFEFIFYTKIVLDVSEEAGSTNYTMRNDGIIDVDYFD